MGTTKSLSLALMAAAGLSVGTAAGPALAADTGSVTVTGTMMSTYSTTGAWLVVTTSNGANYVSYIGSSYTNCNRSADVVKSWLSMAQAAQLSGKTVTISYSVQSACLNQNVINTMVLNS
jgi:hypothetical protein